MHCTNLVPLEAVEEVEAWPVMLGFLGAVSEAADGELLCVLESSSCRLPGLLRTLKGLSSVVKWGM